MGINIEINILIKTFTLIPHAPPILPQGMWQIER